MLLVTLIHTGHGVVSCAFTLPSRLHLLSVGQIPKKVIILPQLSNLVLSKEKETCFFTQFRFMPICVTQLVCHFASCLLTFCLSDVKASLTYVAVQRVHLTVLRVPMDPTRHSLPRHVERVMHSLLLLRPAPVPVSYI